MKTQVIVKLKPSVLDPQGVAIGKSLSSLGYSGVKSVRQGKIFEVDLECSSADEAKKILTEFSNKVLANTVIEDFEVKVGV